MKKFILEKVIPSENQIQILYNLLSERKYGISHDFNTRYDEHRSFVSSHPYRCWYLIKLDGLYVGSFYISVANTIGLNSVSDVDDELLSVVVDYVHRSYKPLEPVVSVRGSGFCINVSPKNRALRHALKNFGARALQVTYRLPNK